MRRSLFLVCTLILSLVLAACGGTKQTTTPTAATAPSPSAPTAQPTAPEKIAGKVVIYSSASKDLLAAMTPALKAKFPELDVEWVYDGTEELVERLSNEFAAGSVKADAIMMADPAYARLLKEQGKLLPYVPVGAEKVKVDRDPEGYYTGVRVLDVVIVYNPELVKPEDAPKSFQDLLDPKWKGQVVMSDPTKSGTAFATVGALVHKYGWEYFQQAKEIGWVVGGGSSTPMKKVETGAAKVGISVESTFLSSKAKGSKAEMIWPADGAIVLESPVAILKSTQNPVAVKAVVDWLITVEAQTLITQFGMHPVISGVPAPKGSQPLDKILERVMKVDWERLAREKGETQDRFVQLITLVG